MDYALQTDRLCKNYRHYHALNGLTMNVPRGSIYGFVGRFKSMEVQALGMLSNITAIVQKQHVNTIESDINVEKDFYGTLREQQINCVKEDIYV